MNGLSRIGSPTCSRTGPARGGAGRRRPPPECWDQGNNTISSRLKLPLPAVRQTLLAHVKEWNLDPQRAAKEPLQGVSEVKKRLAEGAPSGPEQRWAALASPWQSPRFFGYFPANAPLAGVLGDLVSTGLGVIGLTWQSGPAITELEEVVTDWVRQMVGLTEAWSGVIQDTASTSSLVALLCARERTSGYAMARGGCRRRARR